MLVQQKQNIKGFTLLEILVVVAIVGIVSLVGYPRLDAWVSKNRVKAEAEKMRSLQLPSIFGHPFFFLPMLVWGHAFKQQKKEGEEEAIRRQFIPIPFDAYIPNFVNAADVMSAITSPE